MKREHDEALKGPRNEALEKWGPILYGHLEREIEQVRKDMEPCGGALLRPVDPLHRVERRMRRAPASIRAAVEPAEMRNDPSLRIQARERDIGRAF
jgi:hypothetical protein